MPIWYQTKLRFQFDTMSRPLKIFVKGYVTHLSFLVLPYYHRDVTFYRHGYVSPIGFLLRFP